MLTFSTAQEELFYLLDHKPGFDQELWSLVNSGRIISHKFIYDNCGCIYWAYYDCPSDEDVVVNNLDAMFDCDLDESIYNSFHQMCLGTMRWISPLQYKLGMTTQAGVNVWLRDQIITWREAHA